MYNSIQEILDSFEDTRRSAQSAQSAQSARTEPVKIDLYPQGLDDEITRWAKDQVADAPSWSDAQAHDVLKILTHSS